MKINLKLGNLINKQPIEYKGRYKKIGGQTDMLTGKHETIIQTDKTFLFELEGIEYKTKEAIIYN